MKVNAATPPKPPHQTKNDSVCLETKGREIVAAIVSDAVDGALRFAVVAAAPEDPQTSTRSDKKARKGAHG